MVSSPHLSMQELSSVWRTNVFKMEMDSEVKIVYYFFPYPFISVFSQELNVWS